MTAEQHRHVALLTVRRIFQVGRPRQHRESLSTILDQSRKAGHLPKLGATKVERSSLASTTLPGATLWHYHHP
jgi:hypothetical protein